MRDVRGDRQWRDLELHAGGRAVAGDSFRRHRGIVERAARQRVGERSARGRQDGDARGGGVVRGGGGVVRGGGVVGGSVVGIVRVRGLGGAGVGGIGAGVG